MIDVESAYEMCREIFKWSDRLQEVRGRKNIKLDLKRATLWGCGWIHLVQNIDHWLPLWTLLKFNVVLSGEFLELDNYWVLKENFRAWC